jgi:hypothetical protein
MGRKLKLHAIMMKTAFICLLHRNDNSRKVEFMKQLFAMGIFGEADLKVQVEGFNKELQKDGETFFKRYFSELKEVKLSGTEEIGLMIIMTRMYQAYRMAQQNEMGFFRMLRARLSVRDETLRIVIPEISKFLEYEGPPEFPEGWKDEGFNIIL